ncbi:MAG: hypothetical protein C5B49_12975 [Bdellovibrio sp.]|nr:MAG: hypothetical protein C5B49_12975 [Bdellovibrio sp.]
MRAFIAKLLFLISLSAGVVGWEWWRLETEIQALGPVHGSVGQLQKLMLLYQQEPQAQVIFAGDSRAERQLNPAVFSAEGHPAINVAISSGDLWTLVKTLEATGIHKLPLTFIISASSAYINDGNNEKDRFTPEIYFSLTTFERLVMFKSGWFLAARTMLDGENVYNNFTATIAQLATMKGNDPHKGFLPVDHQDYHCDRIRHASNVARFSWYKNVNLDGARWRLFAEAVATLETWPGRYYIFNGPVTTVYHACIDGTYAADVERDYGLKASQLIKNLRRVRFLDFYNDPLIQLPDSLYYDAIHLDKVGADHFSKWWLEYLKRDGAL